MLRIYKEMNWLITVLICGVNFGGFFFRRLDLWHGQGLFFQIGLLTIFSVSFFIKSNPIKVKNISLSLFVLWTGLWTAYIAYKMMLIDKYFFGSLLVFLNILYMVIFYKICVQYLNRQKINIILHWLSVVLFILLIYGVFQSVGIDKFQSMQDGSKAHFATGLIGNPVHFSAYIACLSPLLILWNRKISIIGYGILGYLLLFGCSQGKIPPATGVITFFIVSGYLIKYKFHLRIFYTYCFFLLLIVITIFIFNKDFFCNNQRFFTIKNNFEYFKNNLWLGSGLGSVNVIAAISAKNVAFPFHHIHNEYVQSVFEIGIVGFLIIIYGIIDFFRIKIQSKKSVTIIILKAIFLGFVFQSLTLFPAHLWVCSSILVFVYAGIYCIKNEELLWLKR